MLSVSRALHPTEFLFLLVSFAAAAACNPNACRAVGRGLQPKGVRVKETADFKVYTKGAGSGELKVTIKGPSKSPRCILPCCGFAFYKSGGFLRVGGWSLIVYKRTCLISSGVWC